MKRFQFLFLIVCLCFTEAIMASVMTLGDNILQTTVIDIPVPVNVYTGTVTNGSDTALYVYVPTYLDRNDSTMTSVSSQMIYEDIFDSVTPDYQAIMPDAKYLSTPMNGFIVFAASGDFETLDAEEGAEAFAAILAQGDWSNIENAAAYFFPGNTANGAPQSNTRTINYVRSSSSADTRFEYIDGILTPITNQTITNVHDTVTITNQSLAVSTVPTGLGDAHQATTLKAWAENGVLHVSGLTAGEQWCVYNATGVRMYQGIAVGDVETWHVASLPKGVYIVQSGNEMVKLINY